MIATMTEHLWSYTQGFGLVCKAEHRVLCLVQHSTHAGINSDLIENTYFRVRLRSCKHGPVTTTT